MNTAMYPLTTTTARIYACHELRDRAAESLGITEPSDEQISYERLLDTLGLDDALLLCRAAPELAPIWRRYAVWCARQVQKLMTDQRSVAALDVAERHANGQATDEELAGRKRRARRARGREVAANKIRDAWFQRHFLSKADPDGVIRVSWPTEQAAGFRSKPIGPTTRIGNAEIPTCIDLASLGLLSFAEARRRYRLVVMEDEAAAMDWGLSKIAAKAEIASETERYRDQIQGTPEGSGCLTVEQWAAQAAAQHRLMQEQGQRHAAFFDPRLGEPWPEEQGQQEEQSDV